VNHRLPGRVSTSIAQPCTAAQVRAHRVPGPLGWYPAWVPWEDSHESTNCIVAVRADRGVTLSGLFVSAIADQTWHGRDAVQAVGANQPSFWAQGLADKPGVLFDGSNDSLAIPDDVEFDVGTDSFYCMVALQWADGGGIWKVVVGKGTQASANNWRLFRSGANKLSMSWGSDAQIYGVSVDSIVNNAPTVLGWGVNATAAKVLYAHDGSVEKTAIVVSGTGSNALDVTFGSPDAGYRGKMMISEYLFFRKHSGDFDDRFLVWLDWYAKLRYQQPWWQPILNLTPKVLLVDGVGQFTDAGVTPAVIGDAVYQWTNLGDAANPAVQATAGKRPTRTAAGLDFVPASSSEMAIAGFTSASNDYTVVAVLEPDAVSSTYSFFSSSSPGVLAGFQSFMAAGYDGTAWRLGMNVRTAKQVLAWRWDSGGGIVEMYCNGVKLGQNTYDGVYPGWPAGATIGALGGGGQYFDGKLLSLAVFDSKLSDANLAIVHREMLARYSLTFDRWSIAGCVGAYRPLSQNVVLNGADVSQLTDLTGLGHHLLQANATKQPLHVASGGPNGAPYVEFDGIDERIAGWWAWPQPMHVFSVLMPSVSMVNGKECYDAGTGSSGMAFVTVGTNRIQCYSSAAITIAAGANNNTWMRFDVLTNGASSWVTRSGVKTTGDLGVYGVGGLNLGSDNGGVNFADCRYAEIWGYNRALNAYEVAANDALTLARYAL